MSSSLLSLTKLFSESQVNFVPNDVWFCVGTLLISKDSSTIESFEVEIEENIGLNTGVYDHDEVDVGDVVVVDHDDGVVVDGVVPTGLSKDTRLSSRNGAFVVVSLMFCNAI